ncbi:hypothetical protein MJD09_09740, partial [bacterium]|nr:hypothetical protein [bacterium]
PYFYNTASQPDGGQRLGTFSTKYFTLFGVITIFALVLSGPMIKIMADAKFHDAVYYIPLLLVFGWLTVIYKIFHWSLMHSQKTLMLSVLTGVSCVVTIALLYLALSTFRMGIMGALYAMNISQMLLIVGSYFLSQRYFRIEFSKTKLMLVAFITASSVVTITSISQVYNFPNIIINIVLCSLASFALIRIANLIQARHLLSMKVWLKYNLGLFS